MRTLCGTEIGVVAVEHALALGGIAKLDGLGEEAGQRAWGCVAVAEDAFENAGAMESVGEGVVEARSILQKSYAGFRGHDHPFPCLRQQISWAQSSYFIGQIGFYLTQIHAFLLERIAVADGDGLVLEGLGVDGEAEGGAGFVHAGVAFADVLFVVDLDVPGFAEVEVELLGDLGHAVFIATGEDGGFDGGHAGVELHDDAGGAAGVVGVGFAEEGEGAAVGAGGGFDDVGEVFALGVDLFFGETLGLELELEFLVEVFEFVAEAGVLGVGFEVEVGAVGDAFEFAEAGVGEGEFVFDVGGAGAGFGVVGEFVLVMFAELEVGGGEADGLPPGEAGVAPEFVPFVGGVGADEEFDFHLLELAGAEGEVARGDFVAEGFADLGDAEGDFDAGSVHHVAEVGEDALGGFRAEVDFGGVVLDGAGVAFEHQVKLAGFGEKCAGACIEAWFLKANLCV